MEGRTKTARATLAAGLAGLLVLSQTVPTRAPSAHAILPVIAIAVAGLAVGVIGTGVAIQQAYFDKPDTQVVYVSRRPHKGHKYACYKGEHYKLCLRFPLRNPDDKDEYLNFDLEYHAKKRGHPVPSGIVFVERCRNESAKGGYAKGKWWECRGGYWG